MSIVAFVLFSLFYPINLYIFQFISSPKSELSALKVKVASILVSCTVLWIFLNDEIDFNWNRGILKWIIIGLAPFLLPLIFSKPQGNESPASFLFWRNFVIAPACEELYFRILLAKLCQSNSALSLSFSLAHAHPLMFKSNWCRFEVILAQCAISFCFGFVNNAIGSKMQQEGTLCNIWIWLALTVIHGVANYCGLPLIEKGKLLQGLQIFILISSIVLIFK